MIHLLPLLTIYKATHLCDLWTECRLPELKYNRSKSAFMDSDCFLDLILKISLSYFKYFEDGKALTGNNLSLLLSVNVIKMYECYNIEMVFSLPKSTHLTQPQNGCLLHYLKLYFHTIKTI